MGVAIIVLQLILSLSILVVLHEMGHFFPAKWFKTKVEKFYLFFDPRFSLWKTQKGETEYGIGWLPLGGYVKIAGMVDESMDMEQMKQPPQPWEFRSKPAWQRLIIMLGGVTVNFILGFFLFGLVLAVWGEKYLPSAQVVNGIQVDSLGEAMGLRNGDKIISIGGKPFDKFSDRDLIKAVVIDNRHDVVVEREGAQITVQIGENFTRELSKSKRASGAIFIPRVPYVVGAVTTNFPAEKAGFKVDDKILAVNGEPAGFVDLFFRKMQNRRNEQVVITVERQENPLDITVTTNQDGKIGLQAKDPASFFEFARRDYSFLEALPAGVVKGWDFLTSQLKAFGQMFRGNIKASDSLGGFISIGKLFPSTWNWEHFWSITALLSIILGFMNLLPIPALDGGHVLFLLFEVITGRKPSDKFMEIATIAGFILIIALVLYANGLDILRLIKK